MGKKNIIDCLLKYSILGIVDRPPLARGLAQRLVMAIFGQLPAIRQVPCIFLLLIRDQPLLVQSLDREKRC
jgi:hypothetical protein